MYYCIKVIIQMRLYKTWFLGILLFNFIFAGIFAESFNEDVFNSIPEGNYEFQPVFEDEAIDLREEDLLPLEQLRGHTYKRRDKEDKVKQIYTFKKDGTYSFTTEVFVMKMIVFGYYEISGNEITLFPQKHEAKFIGIKVIDI